MLDFVFKSAIGAILTPGALGTAGVVVIVVGVAMETDVPAADESAPVDAEEDSPPADASSPLRDAVADSPAAGAVLPASTCRSNADGASCSSSAALVTSGADHRLFRLGTGVVGTAPAMTRAAGAPDAIAVVDDDGCANDDVADDVESKDVSRPLVEGVGTAMEEAEETVVVDEVVEGE